nr:MAG TPA: hypothetical protein [Bacteriophage sp.]
MKGGSIPCVSTTSKGSGSVVSPSAASPLSPMVTTMSFGYASAIATEPP